MRRYDEAIEQFRKVLELDPDYTLAHILLGMAYAQKGESARALPEFARARELEPAIVWPLAEAGRIYAVEGKRAEAERVLAELKQASTRTYVPPYCYAIIFAALGRKQEALEAVEQAANAHSTWLTYIAIDPDLDSLRSEPRFQAVVKRIVPPR